MTNVAVRELEPGFSIVSLLGDDAVQAHIVPSQIDHCRLPELPAKTSPSILRLDNVESDEPIMLIIGDGGNAAYRLPHEFSQEEPLPIYGVEACRIVQARIPALGRGPFKSQVEFTFRHSSNKEFPGIHGLGSGSRHQPAVSVRLTRYTKGDSQEFFRTAGKDISTVRLALN